ncbi:YqiA/YcfP family alpha/beta fold hydrolase [Crocosphaera sp. Alani8]|uniref:YqiA/YcfP family alpha/beta fold hydrolase n=1 Tax=Crocosphaera sp. Alani8 TaxID=3038952 RepID=UPI00406C7725
MTMLDNKFTYIYLHGFASSPQSIKAQKFKELFASQNIPLIIPDLNQGDFYNLTLTRQIKQVSKYIENDSNSVVLIGSSLGGLTATFVAEKHTKVKRLILLAPAFKFFSHWSKNINQDTFRTWKNKGELSTYHYGYDKELPLSYQFIIDGQTYQETILERPVPTLIFHGKNDQVIPIESSYDYAQTRKWVKVIQLDSDHGLTEMVPEIWKQIQTDLNCCP